MFSKLRIVIFILILSSMVDAKRCNSCCSCSSENIRANNFKKELNKSSQENGMLKSKTINLGDNFALRVSTKNGEHIGWIHNEFNPSMSIPANSQIHIEQRVDKSENAATMRIFYDSNHEGLFIDLPVIGKYNASQISLPARSVSSIIISNGYQVILYANENNFIVLTSSQKNLGNFNDKMVSLEIQEIFEKKPQHLAIVHSHPDFNGKKTGVELGESYQIPIAQIGSIVIEPEHEVFIYDGSVLTDIYASSMNCISISSSATAMAMATANVQKVGSIPTQYAVFYEDVDYRGPHFILLNPIVYNWTIGKLSSLQIPQDYQVVLWERDSHIVLRGNVPNLVFYLFNDRAMTMVYEKRTVENIENVVIFSKANFYGEMRTLPIGNTDVSEVFYAGSIRVPTGYTVKIVKTPVSPFNAERIFTYVADSSDIRYFIDTPISSVHISQSGI